LAVGNDRPRRKQDSSGRSPLERLVAVCRDFGPLVAMRVVYSKIRGQLFPALALPDAPAYSNRPRVVSILLNTRDHDVATFNAVVTILGGRADFAWEVCICERAPVGAESARTLARLRGIQPWIRLVTTDKSVSDTTAASWTVEQATGEYVAVVAPRCVPEGREIVSLLARLQKDPKTDAALLIRMNGRSDCCPAMASWADCRIVLQRKSSYLTMLAGRWLLNAPALAQDLEDASVPVAYICERSMNL
jgi:hypothetical protein